MFNTDQPNYQSLRSIIAERTNPLVFWVGSGLSAAAGLPIWSELKEYVRDHFQRHIEAQEDSGSKSKQLITLDEIKREADLWISFKRLHELGKTTFEEAVRKAFAESERCAIPHNYHKLFALHIKGIVTLNLDRLATRAFTQAHPGEKPLEFTGNQCGDFCHVLKGPSPFILNAHGIVENAQSWILQHHHVKGLLNTPAYTTFISSVLTNYTVVFVGISADDVAVKKHLDRLRIAKINLQGHYWITHRADQDTNVWAEKTGVLLVRYSADNNHQALGAMLSDLCKYQPKDPDVQDPVATVSTMTPVSHMLSPEELINESEEDARAKLNSYAKYILRHDNAARYTEYDEFRKRYDKCIYKCWYVDTKPPSNILMGYQVLREIAEGAFGRVFEARNRAGQSVALKLLKDEVRRKPEMLQSFRRGVHAMRILAQSNVDGMVGYTDCSEIPAFAVMELVDGPNLKEAVEMDYVNQWEDLLKYAVELTSIIRRAHQLPQRVLHRDIRPANIMLKDYYRNPERSRVVVLDFDLSWYKDSVEVSITQGPAKHGYLAPELTQQTSGVSTRNAAVDSFGIGMTLYYMRGKKDPVYMGHRHTSWESEVKHTICSYKSPTWVSLPTRFADFILKATRDKQAERCDVDYIVNELGRLREALLNPGRVRSTDLLCHELAFRCCSNMGLLNEMVWSYDSQQAVLKLASGVVVTLTADEQRRCIAGMFKWDETGVAENRKVGKYIGAHVVPAIAALRKGNFEIGRTPVSSSDVSIQFQSNYSTLAGNMSDMGITLANAIDIMRLA